jgi:chromate transporter
MINPFIYLLIFFKATLFSSGGFSNLPSLHQDLIAKGWAKEANFGDSVAIGQISPGPNGLWVISLGYLTYGYLGALLALIAISIPPLLVLVVAGAYKRIEHQRWVPGMMNGISLAVTGIFLNIFWTVISRSGSDWRSWLICLVSFGLVLSRRVNILVILVISGLVGYFIFR